MNRIPTTLRLPDSPRSQSALVGWAEKIHGIISELYTDIAKAVNALIMSDTLANRPTATGSLRFYWSTDKKTLAIDDGSWRIPRLEVIATADLPAAAAAQDGRLVIEDVAAGDRNLVFYAQGQRFRLDGGSPF